MLILTMNFFPDCGGGDVGVGVVGSAAVLIVDWINLPQLYQYTLMD
jgi:hypothetical protein